MAVLNDPIIASNINRVGEVATGAIGAQHVTERPIPSSIGHYRVSHRCALVNAQAANSRLFEHRNAHATNLIIPTRIRVKWISSAAHTAIIEDSLDAFKVTGFTAVDTVNTVTPAPSLKRQTMAAWVDANYPIRGVTIAGAAAGMITGSAMTKDGTAFGQLPRILPIAVMAATETAPRTADVADFLDDNFGAHPWVFAQNEGWILENRVLLGAAAGSAVYIEYSFAIVAAY